MLIKTLGSHQLQFEEVFRPVTNYTKEDLFFESVLSLNICLVGVYPVPSSSLVYPLIYIYHLHQSKLPDLGGYFLDIPMSDVSSQGNMLAS